MANFSLSWTCNTYLLKWIFYLLRTSTTLMVIVFTQVNDPVCQPNQQTPPIILPIVTGIRLSVMKFIRSGEKNFPVQNRQRSRIPEMEVADYNTHRDHKHVCDTVLKPLATNIATGSTIMNALSIRRGQNNSSILPDIPSGLPGYQTDGLNKSMVHFVVGGL